MNFHDVWTREQAQDLVPPSPSCHPKTSSFTCSNNTGSLLPRRTSVPWRRGGRTSRRTCTTRSSSSRRGGHRRGQRRRPSGSERPSSPSRPTTPGETIYGVRPTRRVVKRTKRSSVYFCRTIFLRTMLYRTMSDVIYFNFQSIFFALFDLSLIQLCKKCVCGTTFYSAW